MNEKINITKSDGASVSADIICFVENIASGKRFVYYTLNEIVGTGPSSTVKIYVSKVKQDNPALDVAISEEEWGKLKGYMGDALKDNTNAEIKYIPLSELTNPVSISERAIAMPTSYDYINKQRGIYAQNVATTNATSQTAVQEPLQADPTPVTPVAEPAPTPSLEATPSVEPVPTGPAVTPSDPVQPTPVAPTPEPIQPTQVEPTPAVPNPLPVEPAPVTPVQTAPVQDNQVKMDPIDIPSIEKKYAEMIDEINKLKEKEIEAAKRYNATIELSAMHNEQHANYVQNEQIKEVSPAPVEPVVAPTAPTQVVEQVTPQPTPAPAPQPGPITSPAPAVEPAPVTPVVPEPAPATTPQDLETNWFDMPANQ